MSDKITKLSDAILIGCKAHKKKLRGNLYDDKKQATCALGAALVALGRLRHSAEDQSGDDFGDFFYTDHLVWSDFLEKRFPGLTDKDIVWITEMNDEENWSREKIARALAKKGK